MLNSTEATAFYELKYAIATLLNSSIIIQSLFAQDIYSPTHYQRAKLVQNSPPLAENKVVSARDKQNSLLIQFANLITSLLPTVLAWDSA